MLTHGFCVDDVAGDESGAGWGIEGAHELWVNEVTGIGPKDVGFDAG